MVITGTRLSKLLREGLLAESPSPPCSSRDSVPGLTLLRGRASPGLFPVTGHSQGSRDVHVTYMIPQWAIFGWEPLNTWLKRS